MKDNGKKRSLLKGLRIALLAFVCCFLLAGCWDSREIEDRTAISALAVDKTPNGGLKVTAQIPIPLQIAGGGGSGGGGGGKPIITVHAVGRNFEEALNKIQYRVDHKLFFGQMAVIAFSQDVANSGIQSIIDALRRKAQIRRLLYPIIVEKGKASEFVKVNTQMEKIPANFIKMMIHNSVRLGTLPNDTLGRFYVGLSNSAKEPSMLSFKLNKEGKMIETGIAVFKGAKMIGLLNRQDASNLLRVSEENGGGDFTFQAGKKGQLATFKPNLSRVRYHFNYKNGRLYILVKIKMEGKITEITFPFDLEGQKQRAELQKVIEKKFAKQSLAMIKKLQKYDSDILGFGVRVRAFEPEIWDQVDWATAFRNAKVKVVYDVQIRRAGMEMKNSNRKKG